MERPVDTEMAQVVEADGDGAVDLTEHHVNIDAQARGHRQFDGICGTRSKHFHALGRAGQLASQELAFGPMQFQLEDEIVAALPTVIRQKCLAGDEILKSRSIGGRSLGPLAGDEVELSQLEALIF